MNSFLDDLGEEREARIQPSESFVVAKLESIEMVEIKGGVAAKFTFRAESGELFTQNILEPFNETSTPAQRANNIDKIMHLYGAFINSPIVTTEAGAKKVKREVKEVFTTLPARDIKSINDYLMTKFTPTWKNIDCTLKLVYIEGKNKNNLVQFPLYVPFINTLLSHKHEVSTWKWNPLYDFTTPQYKDGKKTDSETIGDVPFIHGSDSTVIF